MLARRFSFVCLIAALFGMSLSRLVAETSRGPRHGAAVSCDYADGHRCLLR